MLSFSSCDSEHTSISKYTRDMYISVLNMSVLHRILKKLLYHRCLLGFEYSPGTGYGRVLNMPRLHKFLKKMLDHGCLSGVLNIRQVLNM